jgi:hypothetical protein
MGIKVDPFGFVYQIVYPLLIDKLVVAMALGQAAGNGDVAAVLRGGTTILLA